MLSGIGDPKELARHKIRINVALRGVGRNLQDRLEVGVVHRTHEGFDILKHADMKPLHAEALAALGQFAEWRIRSVPRAQNAEADALVNQALDAAR